MNRGCPTADDSIPDRKIELLSPVIGRADTSGPSPVSVCRFRCGPTESGIFRRISEVVLSDGRYSGPENLELIRSPGRKRPTRLKCNRHINPDRTGDRPVREVDISEPGDIVHLKGCGLIKVFRTVGTDDDIEYRETGDLTMNELMRLKYSEISRMIETYHRGIKQFRGIERCRAGSEKAQRDHIELASRAFPRLEYRCFVKGISRFEAKMSIIRDAVRAYPAKPDLYA